MSGLALLFSFTTAVSLTASLPAHCLPAANFAASEKTILHKLGDKTIGIKVMQYGDAVINCCINLHDDEGTAVSAAKNVLEQRGGRLIKIDNNGQRMISFSYKGATYTFDPNRIFSRSGIELTLKTKGKINPLAITEVEKFAAELVKLIPDSVTCVIALHNNTDGDYSVKSYQAGGNKQKDAKQVYEDSWQDIDDIALTTDQALFNRMSSFGYNSILQDNLHASRDGSLSVYYGEKNKRYVNIETQHGKTGQYKEMLSKLIYVLDEEKRPTAEIAANNE
jgi:hypothetical protein